MALVHIPASFYSHLSRAKLRENSVPEIFKLLGTYSVPSGFEEEYYIKFLSRHGWEYITDIGFKYTLRENGLLFVAHLDSVVDIPQKNTLNQRGGLVWSDLSPWGADDLAGVTLILYLAHTLKLPAEYMLFVGEEVGCVGSRAFFTNITKYIPGPKYICFGLDRPGYTDLITHQVRKQLAGEELAMDICKEFQELGLYYSPSDRGLLSDSYNADGVYTHAFNCSVGYFGNHSRREIQDLWFLSRLGDVLFQLPWESLLEKAQIPWKKEIEEDDIYWWSSSKWYLKYKPSQTYTSSLLTPSIYKSYTKTTTLNQEGKEGKEKSKPGPKSKK